MQRLLRFVYNFGQAQLSAGAGALVDYGVLLSCRELLGWSLFWSIGAGGVIGAIVNFTVNRYWTFRDKEHSYSSGVWIQLLKFSLTVVGSILLKYLGTYSLERYIGINYKIGKLISDLFVSVLFNYMMQRFWVFRKAKDVASPPQL